MGEEKSYNFVSNGDGWARELVFLFAAGFLLATLVWLGVWYYQARPAQAGALQEKETVLQELEARLAQCTAEKRRLGEANQRLEAEVAQLDQQLKQAWSAYGRCTEKTKAGAE